MNEDVKTPENLQVTSANQWGRAVTEGKAIPFPSGNVARVRRYNIMYLSKIGKIPNKLQAIVQGFISDPAGADLSKVAGDKDGIASMMELLDITCEMCFIEPKVKKLKKGETLAEDEISVEDVDLNDKLYLFDWAQGEVDDVEAFREKQERTTRALLGREEVLSPSL